MRTRKNYAVKAGGKLSSAEETFFVTPDYSKAYQFPYNPDPLCSGNDYKTYDDMRMDDQVKAVLETKRSIVIGSGWQINCENEEIKKFLEDNLNLIGEDNNGYTFEDIQRDCLTCYDYGFSLAEPVFQLENGKYWLKTVKVRPPHGFRFNIDDKGNILSIVQSSTRGKDIEIDPRTIMHVIYQQEFGNPYGLSDLQAAYTAWKSKRHIIKFLNIYLERFAGVTVKGEYAQGSSTQEIDELFKALKSIQQSTTLLLPKDSPIEFLQPVKDSSAIYKTALDMYNTWISRALLVPDLMGLSGAQTSGGAYALGEKQFQLFMSTIQKDRKNLASKINARIIRPLVLANFGDVRATFEFAPYSEKDASENLKMWSDLVKGRVFRPNEEEINYFRKAVGFPEGQVEPIAAPASVMPFAEPKATDAKRVAYKEAEGRKAKFIKDIGAQFKKHEEKYISKLERAGKDIWQSLIDQYKDKNAFTSPEKAFSIEPKYMKPMNMLLKEFFTGLFKESINQAQAEIFPDKKALKYSDDTMLPDEFLQLLAAESFSVVGDYSTQLTKKARSILTNSVKRGMGETEIMRLLRDELPKISTNWLQTLVRTKETEIYNHARMSYFEHDNEAKQIIDGYEYRAIEDDRTSQVCQFLDGKSFKKGEFTDRIVPPLHYNCRSLLIPVTRFQDVDFDAEPSIEELRSMGANLL